MTRNPITDGETVLAPLWGAMMNAHGAEAILNGIAPSVGTGNFDVDTTAGDVFINNTTASVSANTASLTTPTNDADLDSGEFRVDLLTVNSSGTINVAEGTAATEPITPDIPADEAVICAVVVSGDASSLTSADIRDYRTLLESDKDRYVDGGPHEIDAAEFAGGQGTNGQILETDGAAASWVNKRSFPRQNVHFTVTDNSIQINGGDTIFNRIRRLDLSEYSAGVFRVRFKSADGSTAEVKATSSQSSTDIASVTTTSTSLVTSEDTSVSTPSDSDTDITFGNSSGNSAADSVDAAINFRD